MVIVCVLAMLGVFILFSSTSEYDQSMVVAYRLQANAHKDAVLEEALAVLYDRLNRPYDDAPADDESTPRTPPAWKQEVFEAVVAAVADGNGGVIEDLTKDLLAEGLLPNSEAIVTVDGGQVDECTVQFEGFRRLYYTKEGQFVLNDEKYYHDPERIMDPADKVYKYPDDYIGYATVKIKVSYGTARLRVAVHHTATFDIKVVNQAPVAQEFAVFQWLPFDPAANPATADDLNQGGGLKIYPADRGRCYVIGPYVVNSYGYSDGTGGAEPDTGECYFDDEWHDWSPIPSPRACIVKRGLFTGGEPPGRAGKDGDWRVMPTLINLAADLFGLDAIGYSIVNSPSEYFCANKDRGADGDKYFSLFGDPKNGEVERFAGVKSRLTDAGLVDKSAFDGGSGWPGTSGDDPWMVLPEGQLLQYYNRARYEYWTFTIPLGWYSIDCEGYSVDVIARDQPFLYGAHWMKDFEQGFWSAFGGMVFSAGMAAMGSVAMGAQMGLGVFSGAMANNILIGGAIAALVGGLMGIFDSTDMSVGGGAINLADLKGIYPSNYKYDLVRTVTRQYDTLADLPSYLLDQADPTVHPVVLDGTIFIKHLQDNQTSLPSSYFSYIGKGTLASSHQDDTLSSPIIQAPIVPAYRPFGTAPDLTHNDHLNLLYFGVSDFTEAQNGTDMLRFQVAPEVGGSTAEVVASVFSFQGCAPSQDGQEIDITGNYVCGYFNKAKIPESSHLRVRYDSGYRPADQDIKDSFNGGEWHNLSLSFRPVGWYDRVRN